MNTKKHENLLHKELSYQIQGAAMEVRKNFGNGHKESIYQNAFAEELDSRNVAFEKEKNIKVYSPKTGKVIGYYKPDFLVDNKIIIELKAVEKIPKMFVDQLYDYLRNSEYELGYFINFSSPKLYMKRIIYTNDRKLFLAKNLVAISLLLVAFSVFVPMAQAARIFFEPAANTHEVGESFSVSVKLDTQGENINAIDLEIQYPPLLEIKSISKSGSAVQLWVQEPNFTSTGIFISGGSPGGIKSSNTLIAKITMKAKAIGDGGFQLTPASSVLLSDGQGTKASLTTGQASFNVIAQPKKEPTPTSKPGESVKPSPDSTVSPPATPKEEESKDKSKPNKFKILTGQDPRVFGGKYFVSFFTTDSKSGIDRYEIKEGVGEYKIAQAPYLLSDQDGRTVLRVRAYDSAGNYRETVYPGIFKRIWWKLLSIF